MSQSESEGAVPLRPAASIGAWLRHAAAPYWPAAVRVDARERLRAVAGAGLGIALTALIGRWLAGPQPLGPWLIAPMGASAVLVFAVPASPLAQPWSVIGGNTLSALVGIACLHAIGDPAWAGAAAVGLAIAVMFAMRCLHPPGGATALFVVLAQATSFEFAAFPVLANSVVMVLAGIAYNRLTGRRYPHAAAAAAPARPAEPGERFTAADLDAALAHYNQVLDIPRDDLEQLLHHAEVAAFQRTLGALRCADVMTQPVLTVAYGTPLDEAWALMREQGVKALPVIDRARRVVGIVTLADFMRLAQPELHDGLGARLRAAVRRSGKVQSERPEAVGQIMTRRVRVTGADRHAIELLPLFSEGGHHHIPVIDGERRLVGILTQSDLMRALHRAIR